MFKLILISSLIMFLLIIFFQDLKHKAVYWFLFPLVFILSLMITWNENTLVNFASNLLILLVLMFGLISYLSIKLRKLTNPLKGFFALGDVLFLLAILPLFNTYNYLFYFTTGTCFVLFVHLLLMLFKKTGKEIPFAGYMALYLVGMLLFFELNHISLI